MLGGPPVWVGLFCQPHLADFFNLSAISFVFPLYVRVLMSYIEKQISCPREEDRDLNGGVLYSQPRLQAFSFCQQRS